MNRDWWRRVVYGSFSLSGYDYTIKELELIFNDVCIIYWQRIYTHKVYHSFETTEPYHVYPDVLPLLNHLSNNKGIKLGVISNTDERFFFLFFFFLVCVCV